MTSVRTLRVRVDTLGRGSVAIDDFDLSASVDAVEIKARVGGASEATLHFIGMNIDAEVECDEITFGGIGRCSCEATIGTTHNWRYALDPACPIHGDEQHQATP